MMMNAPSHEEYMVFRRNCFLYTKIENVLFIGEFGFGIFAGEPAPAMTKSFGSMVDWVFL